MCFDVVAPDALLTFELTVYMLYDFGKERACACCGIEDLNFVNILLDGFALNVNFNFCLAVIG